MWEIPLFGISFFIFTNFTNFYVCEDQNPIYLLILFDFPSGRLPSAVLLPTANGEIALRTMIFASQVMDHPLEMPSVCSHHP
jgi:hypothetical protein